jgi:hypothetical protein
MEIRAKGFASGLSGAISKALIFFFFFDQESNNSIVAL